MLIKEFCLTLVFTSSSIKKTRHFPLFRPDSAVNMENLLFFLNFTLALKGVYRLRWFIEKGV
mgnify:CR=1 FL=1